jgi:hypothetical protein
MSPPDHCRGSAWYIETASCGLRNTVTNGSGCTAPAKAGSAASHDGVFRVGKVGNRTEPSAEFGGGKSGKTKFAVVVPRAPLVAWPLVGRAIRTSDTGGGGLTDCHKGCGDCCCTGDEVTLPSPCSCEPGPSAANHEDSRPSSPNFFTSASGIAG